MPAWLQRFLQARPAGLARILLFGTVALWGATFVLVKSALADVSPLLFNFLRMGLATLVLGGVNWRHLRTITGAQVQAGALAGLFLAVGYEFQTLGLARTSPARSAFIVGLIAVFVPALSVVRCFRPAGTSRPGLSAVAGALLAFIGLVLLTTPSGTRLNSLFVSMGPGDLLTLVCAVAFAAHLLTLAHISASMPAGVLATLQLASCTIVMLLVLPSERFRMILSPRLLITLAVCSVFATAAAFTIQSFAQQHLPPTQTVLILTFEPVFAWLASLIVLGVGLESPRADQAGQAHDHRALIGALLILAGMLVVDLLSRTRLSKTDYRLAKDRKKDHQTFV